MARKSSALAELNLAEHRYRDALRMYERVFRNHRNTMQGEVALMSAAQLALEDVRARQCLLQPAA